MPLNETYGHLLHCYLDDCVGISCFGILGLWYGKSFIRKIINVYYKNSGRLRGTFLSNRDEVYAGYKL